MIKKCEKFINIDKAAAKKKNFSENKLAYTTTE